MNWSPLLCSASVLTPAGFFFLSNHTMVAYYFILILSAVPPRLSRGLQLHFRRLNSAVEFVRVRPNELVSTVVLSLSTFSAGS